MTAASRASIRELVFVKAIADANLNLVNNLDPKVGDLFRVFGLKRGVRALVTKVVGNGNSFVRRSDSRRDRISFSHELLKGEVAQRLLMKQLSREKLVEIHISVPVVALNTPTVADAGEAASFPGQGPE